jgi:hypothetical protein
MVNIRWSASDRVSAPARPAQHVHRRVRFSGQAALLPLPDSLLPLLPSVQFLFAFFCKSRN